MVSYEAALELREDGYPQIIKPGVHFYDSKGQLHQSKITTTNHAEFGVGEIVVCPTRRELAIWISQLSDAEERFGPIVVPADPEDLDWNLQEPIPYELAKQIKEEGFRQDGDNRCSDGSLFLISNCVDNYKAQYYSPTLTELIDACGERFSALCRLRSSMESLDSDKWRADAINHSISAVGKTPEEATARLWVALNKVR